MRLLETMLRFKTTLKPENIHTKLGKKEAFINQKQTNLASKRMPRGATMLTFIKTKED